MPQVFQVLKCYKCSVFQVHQTKKSNKWECKLCGEKQSIKRHYGLGSGKECRLHVQKLNGIRGEIDELSEFTATNKNSDEELDNSMPSVELNTSERRKTNESKWSNFIDKTELSQTLEVNESMYLGDTEVVLEVPVKKRKKFKPPTATVEAAPSLSNYAQQPHAYNYDQYETVYNYEPNKPVHSFELKRPLCRKTSKPDVSTPNNNTLFKRFKDNTTIPNIEVPLKEIHPEMYDLQNVTEQTNMKHVDNPINTKMYVPPKLNKSSKWAEFADEPDENVLPLSKENSTENGFLNLENSVENVTGTSENIAENLFTLCDESEFDVLEFQF